MGLAKQAWIEAQERGWSAPDKFVCANCVEDDYLKSVVENNVNSNVCDYCGEKSEDEIAAPLETVMEPITDPFFAHFAEPASACVPRDDGEWTEELIETWEALESLPLICHEDLFNDVVGSFDNTGWVACAGGYWLHDQKHIELRYSWQSFVDEVKHRSRYFFSRNEARDDSRGEDEYSSVRLLEAIGKMVEELGLVLSISSGTRLYRVREMKPDDNFETYEDVGPPSQGLATAGRMNPAGISYFYLAFEAKTALAEILAKPPCRAALAQFDLCRDLRILDLTKLPDLPSIFDEEQRDTRETILFLDGFVEAISRPISKDGREHIDYVPSQIVSEFLAQIFRTEDDVQLDGVAYPSAVMPEGKNVVLFPIRDYKRKLTDLVALVEVEQVELNDWPDFWNRIGTPSIEKKI